MAKTTYSLDLLSKDLHRTYRAIGKSVSSTTGIDQTDVNRGYREVITPTASVMRYVSRTYNDMTTNAEHRQALKENAYFNGKTKNYEAPFGRVLETTGPRNITAGEYFNGEGKTLLKYNGFDAEIAGINPDMSLDDIRRGAKARITYTDSSGVRHVQRVRVKTLMKNTAKEAEKNAKELATINKELSGPLSPAQRKAKQARKIALEDSLKKSKKIVLANKVIAPYQGLKGVANSSRRVINNVNNVALVTSVPLKQIGKDNDTVSGFAGSTNLTRNFTSAKRAYSAVREGIPNAGRWLIEKVRKAPGQAGRAGSALLHPRRLGENLANKAGDRFRRKSTKTFTKKLFNGTKVKIKFTSHPFKYIRGTLQKVAGNAITAAAPVIGWICAIICAISLICGCASSCISFVVAIFSYSNDAFATSNSLVENIVDSLFGDATDTKTSGEENDNAGIYADIEDSVGWYCLGSMSDFYTSYEETLEKKVQQKIENLADKKTSSTNSEVLEEFRNQGNEPSDNELHGDRLTTDNLIDQERVTLVGTSDEENKTVQKLSDVYKNNELARKLIYNDGDAETETALSSQLQDVYGMRMIDSTVYYLSSDTLENALNGVTGSNYAYWNASEILAMASVKYQNSIVPYNYRRYTRILQYKSYGVSQNVFDQIRDWFSDLTAANNTWWGEWISTEDNPTIDDTEIYVSSIDTEPGTVADEYDNQIIYVGFTNLTNDAMEIITDNGEDDWVTHSNYVESFNQYKTNLITYIDGDESYSLDEHPEDEEALVNWANSMIEIFENVYQCGNYHYVFNYSISRDSHYHHRTDDEGNDISYYTYNAYISCSITIECQGHYLEQAYVRCATLTGNENLYDIEENVELDIWDSVVKTLFGGRESLQDDEQAVDEVHSMISENWEETYGFDWVDIFKDEDDYTIYGTQLQQGSAALTNAAGKPTALSYAKEFISDKIDSINNSPEGTYTDNEIRRAEIVDAAVNYAGRIKYYYGADDIENGISDCSAFISWSMGIDRTTTADIMGWTEIDYSELQMGDLLCKDGHVRMYIMKIYVDDAEYYVTVENTSECNSAEEAVMDVSGCTCTYYSEAQLKNTGYIAISIEDKL